MVNGDDGLDEDQTAEYYFANVISASDYYPYGWVIPNRKVTGDYRYGFNGQEQDAEWRGGQAVSFRFRIHDPRLGRFLSVDPLAPDYPWYTPYQFAGNIPIRFLDLEGLEPGDDGDFYGEVRVAYIQNAKRVAENIKYWVWVDEVPLPEGFVGPPSPIDNWIETAAPIQIIDYDGIPEDVSSGPLSDYIDYIIDNYDADPVDKPHIVQPSDVSGIKGGRFGCTRFCNKCNPLSRKLCSKGRKFHDGTDIGAEPGIKVYAIRGGTVVSTLFTVREGKNGGSGYGNQITIETILENGDVLRLRYNHLNGVAFKEGQTVLPGSVIGTAGATGNAYNVDNPHVHIRARLNGQRVDPEPYIPTKFGEDGKPEKEVEEDATKSTISNGYFGPKN